MKTSFVGLHFILHSFLKSVYQQYARETNWQVRSWMELTLEMKLEAGRNMSVIYLIFILIQAEGSQSQAPFNANHLRNSRF